MWIRWIILGFVLCFLFACPQNGETAWVSQYITAERCSSRGVAARKHKFGFQHTAKALQQIDHRIRVLFRMLQLANERIQQQLRWTWLLPRQYQGEPF
jgi:hypothetical protein